MRPLLFLVFVAVPLLELWLIIQVGQRIGSAATIIALLGISLVGAALVKREGLRAWRRFQQAVAEGRVPTAEVLEGALLLFGGALLLTPGFATDAVGLALLLQPVRALIGRGLRRRARVVTGLGGLGSPPPHRRPRADDGDVVDVEVVDVQRDRSRPRSSREDEPPSLDDGDDPDAEDRR